MVNLFKLIKLIENGNPEPILQEKNLTRKCNFLINKELAIIENGVLILTPKGKEINPEGLKELLGKQEASPVKSEKKFLINLYYFLILLFLLLILLISFTFITN